MIDPADAPAPVGTCCVAGCTRPAEESWFPDHCALREAGVEPEWKHICIEHDLELNSYVTRMFFGNKYDKALSDYTDARRTLNKTIEAMQAAGAEVITYPNGGENE